VVAGRSHSQYLTGVALPLATGPAASPPAAPPGLPGPPGGVGDPGRADPQGQESSALQAPAPPPPDKVGAGLLPGTQGKLLKRARPLVVARPWLPAPARVRCDRTSPATEAREFRITEGCTAGRWR
jgi:hypothetical protein